MSILSNSHRDSTKEKEEVEEQGSFSPSRERGEEENDKTVAENSFQLEEIRRESSRKSSSDQEDSTPSCRICGEGYGALISPCNCRGTTAFVHELCLARWITCASGNNVNQRTGRQDIIRKRCEICKGVYQLDLSMECVELKIPMESADSIQSTANDPSHQNSTRGLGSSTFVMGNFCPSPPDFRQRDSVQKVIVITFSTLVLLGIVATIIVLSISGGGSSTQTPRQQ